MCESAVDTLLLIEKGKHKSIPSSLASSSVGQLLSAPVTVYYCLLAEDKIDLLSPQILVINFLLQYIHFWEKSKWIAGLEMTHTCGAI